jgi:hypothetical protein
MNNYKFGLVYYISFLVKIYYFTLPVQTYVCGVLFELYHCLLYKTEYFSLLIFHIWTVYSSSTFRDIITSKAMLVSFTPISYCLYEFPSQGCFPPIVVKEVVSTENFHASPSDRIATTTLPDWRKFHTKRNTQILHVGGCAGRLVTSPLKLRNIHILKRKKTG